MVRKKKKSPSIQREKSLNQIVTGSLPDSMQPYGRAGLVKEGAENNMSLNESSVEEALDVTTHAHENIANTLTIILDSDITLGEASHIRKVWQNCIDTAEVIFDLSQVEHIDTAGLQLLLAFVIDHKARGGKTIWKGHSRQCMETAGLLGLVGALGLRE